MFSGFKPLSANFTAIPNQFFDEIVGHYSPSVVTVVSILIRATLGWEDPQTGQRRGDAELPLVAFVRPHLSETSARKGLAGALRAGLVRQTAPAGNRRGARYALCWREQASPPERVGETGGAAPEAKTASARAINGRPARRRPALAPNVKGGGTGESGSRGSEGRGQGIRGLDSTPPEVGGVESEPLIKKEDTKKKKQILTLNVGKDRHYVSSQSRTGRDQGGPSKAVPQERPASPTQARADEDLAG